jgi:succinate dehydrogenase/fumarate reductase flavoprotein subunit
MKTLFTDILVIGAGGAGLRSALSAHEASPDLSIAVVSRGDIGRHGVTATACSDRMAFHVSFPFTPPGGELGWREHAKDIYEGGGFVSDPNLADLLARESADAYYRLAELGVPFVTGAGKRPKQFITDGSSYPRACYTGPYTANDIEKALLNAVKKTEIVLLENLALVSFVKDANENRVCGAICISDEDEEVVAINARAVVIASGGPGRIFEKSVYPESMDGSVWYAAMRAGATLVNVEFIQFGLASPATSLACSGSLMRALPKITADDRELLEDVRKIAPDKDAIELLFQKGASWPVSAESPARAVDIAVWRAGVKGETVRLDYRYNPAFADSDHLNRRMSEIVQVWYRDRGVLLASNGSLSRPIERLLEINPQVINWFAERGIDLYAEPVEIHHAAQHFQGGILINTKAETGVRGLYACGEAAGGQHGANRPGGNALLDCQVMGHVAGLKAARFAAGIEKAECNITDEIENLIGEDRTGHHTASEILSEVRKCMSRWAGVVRTPAGLSRAEEKLAGLMSEGSDPTDARIIDVANAKAAIAVGLGIVRAAMARRESRGAHMLFKSEDDNQPIPRDEPGGRIWNAVHLEDGEVVVTKMEIPSRENPY